KGAEDAADAVRVQAGPFGDLRQGIPLPPEFHQGLVFGGTLGQDLLPQVPSLGDLAGARLRTRQGLWPVLRADRFFALDGVPVLADAVDQAVPRGDEEKAAEVVGVEETAGGLAEAAAHVGPDRLDNVGRIELGTEVVR